MALIPPIEVDPASEPVRTKSAMIVYGSQDCMQFVPITGTLDERAYIDKIKVFRHSGAYKFFSVLYAGRIERTELKTIDISYQERYTNKLR